MPGRCAVLAQRFRQDYGTALVQPDVAGRNPLGGTGLGVALYHGLDADTPREGTADAGILDRGKETQIRASDATRDGLRQRNAETWLST